MLTLDKGEFRTVSAQNKVEWPSLIRRKDKRVFLLQDTLRVLTKPTKDYFFYFLLLVVWHG